MGKIIQLDNHLSNMIAAGEVVERPQSVVKELVENSIDAQSSNIEVLLKDSGIKEINVIDNGTGMSKEDALMAFGRHATSKLKNEQDLFRINTLGFRGEAVPSIASVSKMSLLTSDGVESYEVCYNAGVKVSESPKPCNKGTNIHVNDLFYNTPARLKYLKSLNTELSGISNLMYKFALSHPEIKFTLSNNGKTILNTSGNNDLVRLFGDLYGYEVAKNLLIDEYKSIAFNVKLVLVKSIITRSNKNEITIICNGRYVKSYKISDAIIKAYNTYIPHTRYPIACIYLDLEPLLIDVNVHPSKAIIKISNEEEISNKIYEMASNLLKQSVLIPNVEIKNENVSYVKETLFETEFDNNVSSKPTPDTLNEESSYIISTKKEENVVLEDSVSEDIPISKRLPYLEYVGQVHGTYLIFQNETGMFLVDQHAAAERINYEKYYNILKNPEKISTPLLVPYNIEYTLSEMLFIEEHISDFNEIGIVMTQSSSNSYYIREVPYWMDFDHIDEFIRNLINSFIKDKNINIINNRDRIAKQIACKDSIKANHYLSSEEANLLMEKLNKCNNPYTCPHGRPTIIKLSSQDLEKMFMRIMQ